MKKIEYPIGYKIKDCEYLKDVPSINGYRAAEFKCHCGNIFISKMDTIKNGKTQSCGCIYKATRETINLIHGHSRGHHNETPEYRSWMAMNNRCNNPRNNAYKDYGGRGIIVSDRWRHSFENFFADMGTRPSIKHTLERDDNEQGYYPKNCYWATKKEQSNNKRSSRMIAYKGKTQTLKLWCEELGLTYKKIHKRIFRFGWGIEDAFTLGKQHGSRYVSKRKAA